MFQISVLEDPAVRVAPANLALTQLEAITQQIEATYVDKVRARCRAAPRLRCTAHRAGAPLSPRACARIGAEGVRDAAACNALTRGTAGRAPPLRRRRR